MDEEGCNDHRRFEPLKYQPLNVEREEIRLITLLEGDSSTVECLLEHVSLAAQPIYYALSYCWGDPKKKKEIFVNGCTVNVTTNLEEALRRLRVRHPGSSIWIDALCIDQSNIGERDQQILRMRDIYSKAQSVIAWIGEELESNDADAVAFMETEAYRGEHGKEKFKRNMWPRNIRPYWKRTWIVQEIVLAKDVRIVAGAQSVSWDTLQRLTKPKRNLAFNPELEGITKLVTLRSSFAAGKEIKLLDAMNLTSLSRATDPRDKIFALLGLARDGPSLVPFPDYSIPVDRLVDTLTRAITKSEETLDVLAAKLPREEPRASLPSWHPDWEHSLWEGNSRTKSQRQFWYRICQEAMRIKTPSRGDFSFEIDGNCVITHGVEVDTIDGLGTCEYGTNFAQDFLITQPVAKTSRYSSAQDVFEGLSSLLGIEHGSECSWMLLAAGFALQKDDFGLAPFPRWGLLAKWLDRHGGFLVSGISLQSWAMSIEYPGSIKEHLGASDDYLTRFNETQWWNQRGIAVTQHGNLGMVPPQAQRGDRICLLKAFRNIVILRPWDDGYKIIGYAYVDGMMKGEMDLCLEEENLQCFRIY